MGGKSGSPRRSPHLLEWKGRCGSLTRGVSNNFFSISLLLQFVLISSIAWISWLNISVLIGTLALALFNASEDNEVARTFAYAYAVISVGVLVSSFFSCFQTLSLPIRHSGPHSSFTHILSPTHFCAIPTIIHTLRLLPYSPIRMKRSQTCTNIKNLHIDLRISCLPTPNHYDPETLSWTFRSVFSLPVFPLLAFICLVLCVISPSLVCPSPTPFSYSTP